MSLYRVADKVNTCNTERVSKRLILSIFCQGGMEMTQKSWISIVFSFASQCRGKIALSVFCAIISVVAGLIPYWSVYQIITLFIAGSPVLAEVWKCCWIGLGPYAVGCLSLV